MLITMTNESNLNNALSWMSEATKTEFNCCIGQYHLCINGICEFDINDYRPTVIALYFLYLSECDNDF